MPAIVSGGTAPEWEAPLPTLEGRAWNLGLELDAAQILAPRHAALTADEARSHLFAAIDPALASHLAADDVIVAEAMIGAMDATRPALAALAAVGVRALIARTFAPGFGAAGRDVGIATVVLDTPSCLHTHDRLRLDFDAAKIVNLSSGDRVPMRNLGEAERTALRSTLTRHTAG